MDTNDKIYVTRSALPPLEEFVDEISELWNSHRLTNFGKKHDRLEHELKKYLNVNYVSLFCNGHMALETAIAALQLKGEVITTPFTYVSTMNAIVRNGLTPVFCDIKPFCYTIDEQKIESLITEQTCAILPVHVYGNVCNVYEIEKIAKKYHLKVIYDAAHAFGVKINGTGIGNFGDISMFSFHATKVFHTIEGGCATYSQNMLEPILHNLCQFGLEENGDLHHMGSNAKMSELHAAMGICNLRHISEHIEKRQKIAFRYRELLSDCKGIILCEEQQDVVSNYAYFPIEINSDSCGFTRDTLYEKLALQNIFTKKYFYPLISQLSAYKNKFKSGNTPIAEKISNEILSLPIYPDLPLETVDKICSIICKGVF